MDAQTFAENFELLVELPNGVQKLREMILQLAVQGKLVEHDEFVEPASALLTKIAAAKQRAICDGELRRAKPLTRTPSALDPFALPNSWHWCDLDDVAVAVQYGYTATADRSITEVRMLRITDIQDDHVDWETVPGCAISAADLARYRLSPRDLLVARSGSVGKTYLVESVPVASVFASYLIRVIPSDLICERYLKRFAESPLYWRQLLDRSAGTGLPNVNGTALRSLRVPLPPAEEQHRIVARVDELMALCDELEAAQEKKRETRVRLNGAALHKLTTATDPGDSAHHWQRARDHFDLLYDTPETVGELRQAILQLAVQGKLVKQDPGGEPAEVLLGRIAEERERLVADGEIRKSKPLPPMVADDAYMAVPAAWEWERLGNVARFIDYRGKTPPKSEAGVPLVTAKNVRMGYLSDEPREYVTDETYHEWMTRGFPRRGDVLFTTEAPLGNVATLETDEKVALAQRVIDLQPYVRDTSPFLQMALMSPPVQSAILAKATGTTARGIKAAKLKLIPVPLPPMSEQRRIVGKVDELMVLCDQLETTLDEAQTEGERLIEAAVERLLESGERGTRP